MKSSLCVFFRNTPLSQQYPGYLGREEGPDPCKVGSSKTRIPISPAVWDSVLGGGFPRKASRGNNFIPASLMIWRILHTIINHCIYEQIALGDELQLTQLRPDHLYQLRMRTTGTDDFSAMWGPWSEVITFDSPGYAGGISVTTLVIHWRRLSFTSCPFDTRRHEHKPRPLKGAQFWKF